MTIQTVNLGTAPTGAGGDTFRSTGAKMNENFTNWTHAASRYVGAAAGNLLEVGSFGIGGEANFYNGNASNFFDTHKEKSGLFFSNIQNVDIGGKKLPNYFPYVVSSKVGAGFFTIGASVTDNRVCVVRGLNTQDYPLQLVDLWHTGITTIDSNGFIKAASPIVKLYANKIELNDEAAEQPITFEKLDVGHYLLKGTSGFATEGWYIETPKDANGNILFAVIYQQLENKDIEIKTFKKKFDVESASIIADLDYPVDISMGRWIDIRLQEIPKPVPEMPVVTENDPE